MQGWQYRIIKHPLQFSFVANTSRGPLTERPTWFLLLKHSELDNFGIGEFGIIKGLSPEDHEDLEAIAHQQIRKWISFLPEPSFALHEQDRIYHIRQHIDANLPSLQFAAETAWQDLVLGGIQQIYPSSFLEGSTSITINGLIWMDGIPEMTRQLEEKLVRGFKTIKVKISDANWDQEFDFLKKIRRITDSNRITLRVDANGAFSLKRAREIMTELHGLKIHSIEQPIKAGKIDQMASLCKNHEMPVALDEELIGVTTAEAQEALLDTICPQYLVLKPSLLGGISACRTWIKMAEKRNIGWWVTSALESNVGLNAIAQFVATTKATIPQGLGTGQLYTNNIAGPLALDGENLYYKPSNPLALDPLVNWS
jgi:o-succinylbenzoate synthase